MGLLGVSGRATAEHWKGHELEQVDLLVKFLQEIGLGFIVTLVVTYQMLRVVRQEATPRTLTLTADTHPIGE
ncbi:hypothetical protein PX52LOC_03081 [Limnoglobus roseus]|uniref:Uncharacterized protein n=1 Tax=Limnoglobus roseus TaxID=2598579 RepID=A0A5C1AEM8_9BACT|nr:hypothetical protein PX52LOC_03081 [Limnoglobus roseus]